MAETPANPFKTALGRGDVTFGLWLALADPSSAELCATSGFDWVLVDGEHGPYDLRTTLAVLQAVAPHPSQAIVRVPSHDPALIKQVLDLGACTLLVPMVENAAQAIDLVRATRYPPEGIRGVGSILARASRWGDWEDYLQVANGRQCLIVQVESMTAVSNAEQIARVEGVDGVFVGPVDLAASMGHLGQPAHPEVVAAIDSAIDAILRAGKAPGIFCPDEAMARRYVDRGVRFVAVGADAILLARAARELASRFRSECDPSSNPPRPG
jgi:4-hydroxy-2-oxoheptanedioate aldolase